MLLCFSQTDSKSKYYKSFVPLLIDGVTSWSFSKRFYDNEWSLRVNGQTFGDLV